MPSRIGRGDVVDSYTVRAGIGPLPQVCRRPVDGNPALLDQLLAGASAAEAGFSQQFL